RVDAHEPGDGVLPRSEPRLADVQVAPLDAPARRLEGRADRRAREHTRVLTGELRRHGEQEPYLGVAAADPAAAGQAVQVRHALLVVRGEHLHPVAAEARANALARKQRALLVAVLHARRPVAEGRTGYPISARLASGCEITTVQ